MLMLQINNLSAKIDKYKKQIKSAVNRVIDSGWVVLGPEVKQFEREFSSYLGTTYCVSVANGTDALIYSLKALGVDHGDQVATVANAGMYASSAILSLGASPLFMDVELDSCTVGYAEVERVVNRGVKVVVITQLYGLAVPEIKKIAQLCRNKDVYLLEDCAQAHGVEIDGKKAGTFGDLASFSFYPTKNLGAMGDGGAIIGRCQELTNRARMLRQYGWSDKYEVTLSGGGNSRLDEIQAAILLEFLPSLDQENAKRRNIAQRYSQSIKHPEVTVPAERGLNYVAHLYVVRSIYRDSLRDHLRSCAVASDIHYPIPDYRQAIFESLYSDLFLENTEKLSCEALTLPCYPHMTDAQVDMVIDSVNGWKK